MTRTPKRDHTCIDCRVEFKALQPKQKRCKPCQEKFRNTGRGEYKYKRVCVDCGAPFRSSNGRAPRCKQCWHNANCNVCGIRFERKSQTKVYCSNRCSVWAKTDKYHDGNYVKCLQRDGFQCRKCGTSETLHVHHIDHSGGENVKLGKANNDLGNLITLCEQCHYGIHVFVETYLHERYIDEVKSKVEEFIGGDL